MIRSVGKGFRGCGIALDGLVGCFARRFVLGVVDFVEGIDYY